jgi:multidrug transporter EmrE-like cation transporter
VITVPIVVAYAVFGAAGAAGGWLFHKFFGARKLSGQVAALDDRVSVLEPK